MTYAISANPTLFRYHHFGQSATLFTHSHSSPSSPAALTAPLLSPLPLPEDLAAATSFAVSPSSPSAPAKREKPSLPFTPSFSLSHQQPRHSPARPAPPPRLLSARSRLSPSPPPSPWTTHSPFPLSPFPAFPLPQLAVATSFAGSPSSPSAPAKREMPSLPFTPSFSLEHELEAREVILAACRLALAGYSTTLQLEARVVILAACRLALAGYSTTLQVSCHNFPSHDDYPFPAASKPFFTPAALPFVRRSGITLMPPLHPSRMLRLLLLPFPECISSSTSPRSESISFIFVHHPALLSHPSSPSLCSSLYVLQYELKSRCIKQTLPLPLPLLPSLPLMPPLGPPLGPPLSCASHQVLRSKLRVMQRPARPSWAGGKCSRGTPCCSVTETSPSCPLCSSHQVLRSELRDMRNAQQAKAGGKQKIDLGNNFGGESASFIGKILRRISRVE
ncbi:unnamed protein product [Closterium sp. Naga37s-1]|nr:unnamed protein product [Closterium sp. Naga37s-1]